MEAKAQLVADLPFVYPHVALMPDAHFGKGSSVGTVFGTLRAVIPAAVGVPKTVPTEEPLPKWASGMSATCG